jgi:peroxiredoxin
MNPMIRRLSIASAVLIFLGACNPQTVAKDGPAAAPQQAEASQGSPVRARLGERAPDFTLVDANGLERRLGDFRGRTVVLEWTNAGCPYVKKHYSGAMQALQKAATEDGVVWLTIISSAPGTQGFVQGDEARRWKTEYRASFTHLLLDPTGEIGKLYGASTTPDMRVIDAEGRLLFEGGIDDRPTNKVEDLQGANNYVQAALEDIKAGRPVRTGFAQPYGCAIKYPETLEG